MGCLGELFKREVAGVIVSDDEPAMGAEEVVVVVDDFLERLWVSDECGCPKVDG